MNKMKELVYQLGIYFIAIGVVKLGYTAVLYMKRRREYR